MKNLVIIVLLLTGAFANAQNNYTITGNVTGAKGERLPGATVFLTNTQHIVSTNTGGAFTFNGIMPGSYELVVKMIGYVAGVNTIIIKDKPAQVDFKLKEDNKLLKDVTITATDPNRAKYLEQFIKYFIGESNNADQCKILNPQALNFHYDNTTNTLNVSSDQILTIQNYGLGYNVNYVLTEFKLSFKKNIFAYTGYPYFQELTGSAAQQKRWDKNRKSAYIGSSNHFFRSVYNNTTQADGFLIYTLVKNKADLFNVMPLPSDSVFTPLINFNSLNPRFNRHTDNDTTTIYILYRKKTEPFAFEASGLSISPPANLPTGQLSCIKPLTDTILVDKTGYLTPRQAFFVSGYWAWQKVSESLPSSYGADMRNVPSNRLIKTVNVDVINTAAKVNKSSNRLTEKVYLQLDRSYYTTGDTLWFKAYAVIGPDHKPSTISNVLNVELTDSRDSIKKSIKLLLKNGVAQGDFDLPFSLESGNYTVRAYTNYLRNTGNEYFFAKNINIFNPAKITTVKAADKKSAAKTTLPTVITPKVDVQFFPEGGHFIAGVSSKIAFKAVGENGLGVAIKGMVTDDQNNIIANFECGHLGMGTFFLTADAGKTYTAKIKLADSSVKIVQLPKTAATGYTFSVSVAGPDHIRVIAQQATDLPGGELTLVAKAEGVNYFEGKSKPGSGSFITTIAKRKFPTGIVQLTLYSEHGEPLNERLVFIQNNDQLKIDIADETQRFAPQQKVKLKLVAKTGEELPANGSFSISVIDETKQPASEENENSILADLLLTSDLQGYIETPGYYFASANEKVTDDLDALMLTQGYRTFKWMNDNDTTAVYKPDTGLSISGYLKTYSGKPIPNGKIMLFTMGGSAIVLDTIADSKRHFTFNKLFFSDSTKFMLQGANEKERANLQIMLDKPGRPKVTGHNYTINLLTNKDSLMQLAPFIAASKVKYAVREKYHLNDKSRLLKEVTIKDHNPPVLKHSDNLNGPGNADYIFTAKDIASFKCGYITTCLEGRMPGIGLSSNGANSFLYLTRIAAMNRGIPSPMLVLIDGNPGDITTLSPNAIESIEVLSNMGHTAIYGGKGNAGIILVTTKRGPDEVDIMIPSPGTITYRPKGLYKTREFYSPQYDNPATNKEIADLRTTIYWNPMLTTDKDGNASFEYFNAGKGDYKVTVEGIDGEGKLGRAVYRYKVE